MNSSTTFLTRTCFLLSPKLPRLSWQQRIVRVMELSHPSPRKPTCLEVVSLVRRLGEHSHHTINSPGRLQPTRLKTSHRMRSIAPRKLGEPSPPFNGRPLRGLQPPARIFDKQHSG